VRFKLKQLEAYNRKIHRITLGWHDALNDEILNLPKYKSMTLLTLAVPAGVNFEPKIKFLKYFSAVFCMN